MDYKKFVGHKVEVIAAGRRHTGVLEDTWVETVPQPAFMGRRLAPKKTRWVRLQGGEELQDVTSIKPPKA